ncbi:hypothetical protein [Acinetobacter radioresistens]|uniref:hypothetical protein n=1 Tax=Acinetobacter radioresistens TaxID=40216 RepID=UPI000946293B|nr:hypothetical protein [Acinetobacter radioresistens]
MPYLKWILPLCGTLLLSACGEDSNFTAGVSLGGSGTGNYSPSPTPPINVGEPSPPDVDPPIVVPPIIVEPPILPPPIVAPPIIVLPPKTISEEYSISYSGDIENNCAGIRRSLHLVDNQTGQILELNKNSLLPESDIAQSTNLTVQMTVQNLTNNLIYEYIEGCTIPFQLKNTITGIIQQPNQQLSCLYDENIQVYRPLETKIYQLKFNLPLEVSEWTLRHRAAYSSKDIVDKGNRINCNDLYIYLELIN